MLENNNNFHLVRRKKHNIGEKRQFSSPPGILLEQIFVCAAGKLDTSKTFPETSINIFPTDIDRLLAENMCFRLNTKCKSLKKTRELTHVQREAVNSKSSETFDRNQAKLFEETQAGNT